MYRLELRIQATLQPQLRSRLRRTCRNRLTAGQKVEPWLNGPTKIIGVVSAIVILVIVFARWGSSGVSPTAAPGAAPDTNLRPTPQPAVPPPLAPGQPIDTGQWQLIAKDPASHAGERIIIYGIVTQFDAATGPASFRALVDAVTRANGYDWDAERHQHVPDRG